jgi:predicted DNA-binding transcriptional regulator AlpA
VRDPDRKGKVEAGVGHAIWRLERRGDFPSHRRISPNAVAWVEHEIAELITAKNAKCQ